jgi:hypothetical protein
LVAYCEGRRQWVDGRDGGLRLRGTSDVHGTYARFELAKIDCNRAGSI